jgi:atypical dual specificity phosphatase
MTQPIQPITKNLWWVIPQKLAGVRKPTADELSDLKTVGIGAIVSVLADRANLDLYNRANIPHLWLPIQEASAPSREQMQQLQDFVELNIRQGLAVAVHCTGGIHRAGTMLAAYLIWHGSTYDDAMQTIQSANPTVELELAQISFLQELAAKIRS